MEYLFLYMFYLGGVSLAFFLTLLLVSKKGKTLADKILAVWLFIITLHLLLYFLKETRQIPQTLGLGIPFPLVHGPFLYIYTLALTNRLRSLRMATLHFLPFLGAFIYLIDFLTLPVKEKIYVFDNNGAGYETFIVVHSIVINISGVLYVIISSIVLRRHRIAISNQFSNTDKINLAWLQYLIYGIALIWILVFWGNDDWIYGSVVLFILFIGFFGIRQVGIFYTHLVSSSSPSNYDNSRIEEVSQSSEESTESEKRKYQKSGLSLEQSKSLHDQLERLMREEKPFIESELSLADLASQLQTQPNHLSQVINECEGKNFYDYINTLRINEFKHLAASPDSRKYTLLALAQQCGFNSKSSFNRYFKKVTGQLPSEYMLSLSDNEK